MLQVKNISSGYGKKQILYDVSLEVNPGDVVLLSGGNGSGKSTLLKCIYNLLPLWSGEIWFEGEKIERLKSSDLIKKGIVYVPQKDNTFLNLSVQNNLELCGNIYCKIERKRKIEEIFSMLPKLQECRTQIPFNMSGGEKQLLCCGMALMHNPKLILFDEPLAGLSDPNIKNILGVLDEVKKAGKALLIVEHQKEKMNTVDNKVELYLVK